MVNDVQFIQRRENIDRFTASALTHLLLKEKNNQQGAAASLSLVLPLKSCLAVDEMFVFVFYLEMKY